MIIDRDDKRLIFKPVESLIVPPRGIIQHYKDCWWCCDDERGLLFWKSSDRDRHISAQCNSNELVTRSLISTMYPWAVARCFPSIFMPVNINDYIG